MQRRELPCQASVGEGAGFTGTGAGQEGRDKAQNTKLLFAAPHLMSQLPSQAHSGKER